MTARRESSASTSTTATSRSLVSTSSLTDRRIGHLRSNHAANESLNPAQEAPHAPVGQQRQPNELHPERSGHGVRLHPEHRRLSRNSARRVHRRSNRESGR